MTVSIEVYQDSNSVFNAYRYCVARTKIAVEGVYSQAVKVCGQFDNTSVTDIFLTLKCQTCSVRCYKDLQLKNVVIWEESTLEFSDSVSLTIDIEEGECVNCAVTASNKCSLPCDDEDCEQHDTSVYEFDAYDGWTKKED